MNGTRVCGQCGAEVSGYSAEGLCPKCMLLGGLDLEGDEALSDSAPAKSETRSPKAEIGRLRYFGDYELLEEIARGGMGVVYKARQVTLNRIVAVKMILAGQLANAAALQRFLAEAESAANLHHPNIVAIYEVGEHDGQHYFSMEYVEGQDLAALVRQKPLPAAQAARYVRLIAEAIQYAHERGTLHRDLKPSNVLLDSFDQPRITDFGLAKQVQGDSDLTQSGQVLGTPSFMPPEQASGRHRAMGSASDIYSLGAILYHLLAGRAPFVADTAAATLRLVIEAEPVSPRLLSPSVPRDVETICLKCLEKIPTKRYPTAQELADELSRFLRGEPIQARPVSPIEKVWRWCRREPVTASTSVFALLAALLGLAGVVWQLDRAETQRLRAEAGELTARHYLYDADMDMAAQSLEEGNQARAWRLMERHRPGSKSEIGNSSFETKQDLRGWEWRYMWRECLGDELRTVATHSNEVHDVAFSPDGLVLASAGADGTVKIWNVGLARELLTLGHGGGINGLVFSPDGRWLVTGGAEGIIRFWDTATWQLHRSITNRTSVSRLAFSADNRSLAASAGDGMTVWEVATGREQAHAESHVLAASQYPVGIAFGPDSRTVAYAKEMDTVGLLDTFTGTERFLPIEPIELLICSFAFSHDGSKLFGAGSGDKIKVWDVASKTLLTNLQVNGVEVKCLALSLDGLRLVAGYDDCHSRIWEVNTWKQLGTLWGHRNTVRGVAFSPDGALVATGSSDGMVKLWSTAPMVHDHDWADFPTIKKSTGQLSADGRYLINAVLESADGQAPSYSIWDTAQLKLIHSRPVPVSNWRHVAVANDGTRLAFGDLSGTITLWDDKQSQILAVLRANLELGDVLLSPDAKMLVAAGLGQIIVWDLTTLQPVYTNAFPISTLSISTDGRYIAGGGDNGSVRVLELRTGREVKSFSAGRLELWNVGFSPDGKTLFTIDTGYNLSLWELPGGRQRASFSSELSQIGYAAISIDGKRLAGSLSGGPIKVWDLETYQEVGTFWGLNGDCAGLAFLPDGETLVGWTVRDIRRWRASSWAEIKDTEKRVKSLDR